MPKIAKDMGRPKVLLVDDESDLFDAMQCALRKEPFELVPARSAKEALAVLRTADVRVIVSDERMPGLSGTELLALTANARPDVPRILFTGHVDVETAMRAVNDGRVFRMLRKPAAPAELARAIKEALAEAGAPRGDDRDQRERRVRDDLERTYPGITTLEVDESGAIIIDDASD